MKDLIKVLLVIALILSPLIFYAYHNHEYTMQATCMKKLTAQDRDGRHIYYYVVLKYENGEFEEIEVQASTYFSYAEGGKYNHTRYRFEW